MTGQTSESVIRRIALLIDGDNAQPALLEPILTETNKFGVVPIRRIYGDWTKANMKGWKETLQTYAIQPIQQFAYTTGKNATDSALIIDAMDTLADGVVDGICIVSSDSDYTRLATRAREKGFFVMGIGRKNTPRAFVNACEAFVYTENLVEELSPDVTRQPDDSAVRPADLVSILTKACEMAAQEDGWAFLGVVGSRLRQLDPSFDPRTYGHKQLSQLFRSSHRNFELREETTSGGAKLVYVRAARTSTAK